MFLYVLTQEILSNARGFVSPYVSTRCNDLEDSLLHTCRSKNLKSHEVSNKFNTFCQNRI